MYLNKRELWEGDVILDLWKRKIQRKEKYG